MKSVCTFPHTFSNNDEFNSLGPALEKNPVFCGNQLFLHCEVFLLAVVDTLVYSVNSKIYYQAVECFKVNLSSKQR